MSDNKRTKRRRAVTAEVAHSCLGRTRLVLRDKKGDRAFFEQFCDDVLELQGVVEVEGRTLTGSLIIRHPGVQVDDLIAAAKTAGVLQIRPEAPPPDLSDEFEGWKSWLEEIVGEGSGRALSLNKIAAIGFLIVALIQIQRGQPLPAAATALWYAISLLGKDAPAADPGGPGEANGV